MNNTNEWNNNPNENRSKMPSFEDTIIGTVLLIGAYIAGDVLGDVAHKVRERKSRKMAEKLAVETNNKSSQK